MLTLAVVRASLTFMALYVLSFGLPSRDNLIRFFTNSMPVFVIHEYWAGRLVLMWMTMWEFCLPYVATIPVWKDLFLLLLSV